MTAPRIVRRTLTVLAISLLVPASSPTSHRTWANEIDVCATATADAAGCEWLAGILLHRRCRLESYQTFAAALFVGASFEHLYSQAVAEGHCDDLGP